MGTHVWAPTYGHAGSEPAVLVFAGNIFASPGRERHDGERGADGTARDKAAAVCDEEILDIPGLVVFIHNGF